MKTKGSTVVGTAWGDSWIRIDDGYMLVDGSKAGLKGIELLEVITKADHEARLGEEKATALRLQQRVDDVCKQVGDRLGEGKKPEDLRRIVAEQVIAAEMSAAHHRATRRRPLLDPRRYKNPRSDSLASEILDRLIKDHVAVVDEFFTAAELQGARRELHHLDDRLKPNVQSISMTRDDRMLFLPELTDPNAQAILDVQRGLPAALGHWRGRPLAPSDAVMAAVYAPGGRYKRHRDNGIESMKMAPQNPRALTAIFYATPDDWDDDTDMGHLRFYYHDDGLGGPTSLHGDDPDAFLDIAPRPGRLVVFDSFFGHEVLKPRRHRAALTFWIYADYTDLDACAP